MNFLYFTNVQDKKMNRKHWNCNPSEEINQFSPVFLMPFGNILNYIMGICSWTKQLAYPNFL